MLVPVLSSKFIEKKPKEFAFNFIEIFQLGILLLTFVIPIFTSTSLSIISIFFDKGKISKNMLIEISRLTIFYSWSTLAVFIYVIFGMALLSSNRSKKYAFWGVVAQIVSILINLTFVKSIGIYIFPISLFMSHIITGFIMFYHFPYKSKLLLNVFFKYITILILTTMLVFFSNKLIKIQINPFLNILNNSVLTGIIIILFIYLFNLEEKKIIYNYYLKLKQKCRNF